ncbi:MAG: hypothetical protein WCT02_01485 [Candidatus Paceibacterota bacterium]
MRGHSRLQSRQSKRFIERKKTRVVLGWFVGIVALASWFVALTAFTHLSFLAVSQIEVQGADQDIENNISAATLNSLQGKYWGLFSKDNIFIYSKADAAEAVRVASERIDSVNIKRSGLNSLLITVREKIPVALICPYLPDFFNEDASSAVAFASSSPAAAGPATCYLADKEGFIFQKAPFDLKSGYNRYYIPALTDNETSRIIGNFATSTAEFVALQDFYNSVSRAGLKVLAILAKDKGEYEMYVQTNDNITVVYFNDSRSFNDQLSNLISFWNKMTGSFEYIDVRYGSNVFYRQMQ